MPIYAETCDIRCTDNGNHLEGEVLQFSPGKFLIVSINRSIRMQLHYNDGFGDYVGSMTGLEFVSKGPKQLD